jgi:hypothetical protein
MARARGPDPQDFDPPLTSHLIDGDDALFGEGQLVLRTAIRCG